MPVSRERIEMSVGELLGALSCGNGVTRHGSVVRLGEPKTRVGEVTRRNSPRVYPLALAEFSLGGCHVG